MTLTLYAFPWGVYPRRVLIQLREKGATDVDVVDVDMVAGENRAPWFQAINPAGTVPVLRTEAGDLIRESGAIMEYLEEVLPGPRPDWKHSGGAGAHPGPSGLDARRLRLRRDLCRPTQPAAAGARHMRAGRCDGHAGRTRAPACRA